MRILLLMATMAVPAAAQRVPVAPAYVAAVVAHSVGVEAAQVTMLSSVMATKGEPELEVGTAERMDARRSRVRLRCKDAAACLPFYAVVQGAPVVAERSVAKPAEPLMKSGGRATLVFDDGRMRIVVPVIALEPGALGKQIRVASVDHKHTWKAEVTGADTLKGAL